MKSIIKNAKVFWKIVRLIKEVIMKQLNKLEYLSFKNNSHKNN